jgi:hypothetical protein
MLPSPFRLGWTVLLVLFLIASPSSAQIVTVTQDLGTTQGTTGIATSVTTGATMGGMQVSAFFTNGSSQTVPWIGGFLGFGSATGTGWMLTESGDTDTSSWMLTNSTGFGLTRLVIDGGPGKTVFDRTFGGMIGTPGTSTGRDFVVTSGGSGTTILATYHDQVAVIPNPPVGDIFRSLDIAFQNTGGFASGQTLGFGADTDSTVDVLTPLAAIPEPSSLLLFSAATLGLVGYRHYRRKQAA